MCFFFDYSIFFVTDFSPVIIMLILFYWKSAIVRWSAKFQWLLWINLENEKRNISHLNYISSFFLSASHQKYCESRTNTRLVHFTFWRFSIFQWEMKRHQQTCIHHQFNYYYLFEFLPFSSWNIMFNILLFFTCSSSLFMLKEKKNQLDYCCILR